jgi:L-alanine-DL-glutamate epimerase-like enolase superfamily enzyme
MSVSPVIERIELTSFIIRMPNIGTDPAGAGVSYRPGDGADQLRFGLRIFTDAGVTGEYVPPRGRATVVMSASAFLAHGLIGKRALERERIYRSLRQATKHVGEIGIGALDIALWDIAGKLHEQPVYRLLGGYRERLPAYASTLGGDRLPDGLSSPGAYADFAERCLELGYRAYKTHGWSKGDVAEEGAMLRAVAERVGSRMALMYDASCHLSTFHDAVQVGKVCDEHDYFWYEDPYSDGGVTAFSHQRLKQFVKTPILLTEHIHTPEVSTDLLLNGATDFARPDPDYDCGITGSMKIAAAADALGMDTEVHACGPAMRQVMAALGKSNYYEVNLLHPVIGNAWELPVYTCGYSDALDCVDADGCVAVPQDPGLGVRYDWDYIERHKVDQIVIGQ